MRWFALFAAVAGTAAAQDPADVLTRQTFSSESGASLPYRLFAPAGATAEDPLPLVLFLHGAGERGTDNEAQLRHGVRTFLGARQKEHPCFVAAPQCPTGRWWDVDLLLALAERLRDRPDVDDARVYVTGLSMGGFATWHMIGRRPDLFAAAVPVCGGGEADKAPGLVGLPIWAFHGEADRTVPVAQSRTMVEAIRKAGGEPKYTEYPGVGHDSWTRTYRDPAVHEWLFAQQRPREAAAVTLRDGDRIVFLGDSITEAGAKGKGYVVSFGEAVRERMPDAGVEVLGAGISGNRVPDLLRRLDRDVLAEQPTVVVVYIGINDVWHAKQGRGTPADEYEAGLREIVQRLRAGGARVVLCTPTVIGEKRAGTNELDEPLEAYAETTRRVAADVGAPLVDLRRTFVEHLAKHNEDDAERGVLTTDGVHLNAAGNRLVAETLVRAMVK